MQVSNLALSIFKTIIMTKEEIKELMNKEGPEKRIIPERIIPEHVEYSCFNCKFYSHDMVRSGIDPIYSRDCSHPEANYVSSRYGNLNSTETPSWCPFLKDN